MSPALPVKRVLLCEDKGVIIMALRKALIRHNFKVIGEVRDALAAVTLARQLKPDVILMDIGLPGSLSGLKATREILQEQTIPILILSPFTDQEHLQAALAAGACGYLVKPFTSEQLLAIIAAALARFQAE